MTLVALEASLDLVNEELTHQIITVYVERHYHWLTKEQSTALILWQPMNIYIHIHIHIHIYNSRRNKCWQVGSTIKALVNKPDNLGSFLETYMIEDENQLL